MKRTSAFHFLLTMALMLPLFSCAEGPVVQRRVPFNEAEFKWTRGKGTGAVEGQAYIQMTDRSLRIGRHTYLVLFPVNAYTTEFIQRRYENGENLAMADDREAQYLCDEYADHEGRFSMRDLAPGEYYLGATVPWSYTNENDDGSKSITHHYQYIWARFSVRNGETTHITSWSQGADKRTD